MTSFKSVYEKVMSQLPFGFPSLEEFESNAITLTTYFMYGVVVREILNFFIPSITYLK